MSTENAIHAAFVSPNVPDANLEPANVVDVVHQLAAATRKVATAITADVAGGPDVNGGHVESLAEAVMGASKSLQNIADAIADLAQAVREHGGGVLSTTANTALPPRPKTPPVKPHNIPDDLKTLDQWVLWGYEPTDTNKWTKPPYAVDGGAGSSTDPTTWASFDAPYRAYE